MRWPDAVAVVVLAMSMAVIVITAVGTGGAAGADQAPPSSPIVVDAYGREVAPLGSLIEVDGSVGVMLVGSVSTK